jgi:hypothetical protein
LIAYRLHSARDRHACQASAVVEATILNTTQTPRDRYACECCAVLKDPIPKTRHRIGDINAGQVGAVLEDVITYRRHTTRDNNTRHAAHPRKGVIANRCHGQPIDRTRDHHRSSLPVIGGDRRAQCRRRVTKICCALRKKSGMKIKNHDNKQHLKEIKKIGCFHRTDQFSPIKDIPVIDIHYYYKQSL